MTNSKATKKALFMSIVSLFICFTMLMGATFAWFTDTVVSGNNKIQAGNLDVGLEYANSPDGEYTTVEGVGDVFVAPVGETKGLWEPGHTEVAYLKVTNKGSLALKYTLSVAPFTETVGKNADNEDIVLSDILRFTATEPLETVPASYTRETAQAAAMVGDGTKLYDYKEVDIELLPGKFQYIALVVYMPETVGNEANYRGEDIPTIEFALTLNATQQTYESDSFDDQYDEEAKNPAVPVYVKTADKLGELLATGGSAALTGDISASSTIAMNGGVLDGNGKTVTATTAAGTGNATINPTGGTIKNLVLEGTGNTRSPYGIGSIQFSNTALTEDMFIENVDVSKTRMAIDLDANGNSVYVKDCELANMIQIANQQEAVFEDCHFYCDGTTPAMLGNGTNNIMLLGNMTFINCHFEENINLYVDDRCSGTIKFINCTYGNNGVADRPFEPTVGFFTWWMEPQGVAGYGGSFGDGDPGRTNFTCIVDDTTVWEANN